MSTSDKVALVGMIVAAFVAELVNWHGMASFVTGGVVLVGAILLVTRQYP